MKRRFHPRRQGDLGEAAAIHWLTSVGAIVSFPLFHSPDYDVIADLGEGLHRVQVKTSRRKEDSTGHFTVHLATNGGNQSWTGLVKKFDPSRFDFLFALVEDGRRWFIPSVEIDGRHSIVLGGDKYSEFQVGRAALLDHAESGRSTLDSARGGAGVGEPGRSVKSVPHVLSGFDSHPPHFSPPSGGDSRSGREEPAVGRTRMSANHQVTVPLAVAAASQVEPGDRFRVESDGTGRFVMTRIEEYMQQHLDGFSLRENEEDG
jgi:hypothetical protein